MSSTYILSHDKSYENGHNVNTYQAIGVVEEQPVVNTDTMYAIVELRPIRDPNCWVIRNKSRVSCILLIPNVIFSGITFILGFIMYLLCETMGIIQMTMQGGYIVIQVATWIIISSNETIQFIRNGVFVVSLISHIISTFGSFQQYYTSSFQQYYMSSVMICSPSMTVIYMTYVPLGITTVSFLIYLFSFCWLADSKK